MDWLTIWEYNAAENTVSTFLVQINGSADGHIDHLTGLIDNDDSGRWGYSMVGGVPEGAAEFALSIFPPDLPGAPQVRLVGPVDFGDSPPTSITVDALTGSPASAESMDDAEDMAEAGVPV